MQVNFHDIERERTGLIMDLPCVPREGDQVAFDGASYVVDGPAAWMINTTSDLADPAIYVTVYLKRDE